MVVGEPVEPAVTERLALPGSVLTLAVAVGMLIVRVAVDIVARTVGTVGKVSVAGPAPAVRMSVAQEVAGNDGVGLVGTVVQVPVVVGLVFNRFEVAVIADTAATVQVGVAASSVRVMMAGTSLPAPVVGCGSTVGKWSGLLSGKSVPVRLCGSLRQKRVHKCVRA